MLAAYRYTAEKNTVAVAGLEQQLSQFGWISTQPPTESVEAGSSRDSLRWKEEAAAAKKQAATIQVISSLGCSFIESDFVSM